MQNLSKMYNRFNTSFCKIESCRLSSASSLSFSDVTLESSKEIDNGNDAFCETKNSYNRIKNIAKLFHIIIQIFQIIQW